MIDYANIIAIVGMVPIDIMVVRKVPWLMLSTSPSASMHIIVPLDAAGIAVMSTMVPSRSWSSMKKPNTK